MKIKMNSGKEIIEFVKKEDVKIIDLRFMDFPGLWQHFSIPAEALTGSAFEEGLGFDGSSIRGWQAINESDMLVMPEPQTAKLDPFTKEKTLFMICNIKDPITKEAYPKDPRNIAIKAEKYLKSTGIADTVYFGAEAEFFIFNSIRFSSNPWHSFYKIDSDEAVWNTGKKEDGGNKGYKIRNKEGYFPCPPTDKLQDLRTEMVLELMKMGIEIEAHHHEVATAGQVEIDMKFDTLVNMADKMLMYKYVCKNVAYKNGYTVTFMPKPIFGDNGSGMHCHQSLWKNGKPLFAGDGYAGLSDIALYYIGGLLKHAKALTAITNPTVNSFKRLVPGFEAPVNLAYSSRNRSAAIRIPMYSSNPKAKRIEFRCPDPSCNPYIAFAAMLLAGINGIQNKIDPGEPLDKDIYDLPPEELAKVEHTPYSLRDALDELKKDNEFLLKGDVFTEDVINTWINYKLTKEVQEIDIRPNPYEFFLYYDI